MQRNFGIKRITARRDHVCYGMGLGIIVLDDVYPGFPGDVRNASAFPYPIQYQIAPAVTNKTLVWDADKSACLDPILTAARQLEKFGVRAIAAECGYFAYFQREVAAAVSVPVFMSSLLQVPLAQQVVGPHRMVAILCAQRRFLTDKHLQSVGIDTENSRIGVFGAQDEWGVGEFDKLWDPEKRPAIPHADYETAERQMIEACKGIVAKNPNIGAFVFECTGMQPFARAVQQEIDLPIFSWSTMLDYAYSFAVHRDFYGHV